MRYFLTVVLALCFTAPALAGEPTPPCGEGEVCAAPPPPPPPCYDPPVCSTAVAPAPAASEPAEPAAQEPPPVEVVGGPVQGIEMIPVVDLPSGPEPKPEAPPPPPSPYRRHFGAQLDVGFPDAAALSFVYRPVSYVRVSAGGTYDYISGGVRAGLTILPFGRFLSITEEGGWQFDGNANKVSPKSEPALQSVGYKYANFHLGLDFGRERFVFFIHGGMSYFTTTIKNLNEQFNGQVTFPSDPIFKAWVPSGKTGLIVYFK